MTGKYRLNKKTAVITGATRGIGYAIAQALLQEGANVIATGTKSHGQVPTGAEYQQVDLSNKEQILNFADKVRQLAPEILINNAGINKISNFVEIESQDFEKILSN